VRLLERNISRKSPKNLLSSGMVKVLTLILIANLLDPERLAQCLNRGAVAGVVTGQFVHAGFKSLAAQNIQHGSNGGAV